MEVLNPINFKGAGGSNPIDTRGYYSQGNAPTTDYSISVFTSYFPEFKDLFYLKGELIANNRYETLFSLYFTIAESVITSQNYQDMVSYCISLYIAHRLQLAINRTKNVGNVANLNSVNASETNGDNKGGKDPRLSELSKTEYGEELRPIMKAIGTLRGAGVY